MTHFSPEYFIQFGILTGSRAFGVSNKISDYDIAITHELFIEIMSHIEKGYILSGNDSGHCLNNRLKNKTSAKFKLDSGEVINFIAYETIEALEVIELINSFMIKLPLKSLKSKRLRHKSFEEFIRAYMTPKVLGKSNNLNGNIVDFL